MGLLGKFLDNRFTLGEVGKKLSNRKSEVADDIQLSSSFEENSVVGVLSMSLLLVEMLVRCINFVS